MVRGMRGRTLTGAIAILALALVAAGGVFAAWTYANRPTVESVSPAPGITVNGTTPVRVVLQSPDEVATARLELDGADVTASATRTANGFELPLPHLVDGPHRMVVRVTSSDLLGDTSSYSWTFRTDTSVPRVATSTSSAWTANSSVQGVTEPKADVTVSWDGGQASTSADAAGRFDVVPGVPDGATSVVITARDAAGNASTERRVLRVDRERPQVKIAGVKATVKDTDRPGLFAFVDAASPTTIVARINDQEARVKPLSIGYTIETGRLPQGRNTLDVEITNALGKTVTRRRTFVVDSTDKLTNNLTLLPGARGDDVANLTRRLRMAGFWTGKLSWRYDQKVFDAVKAYQEKEGLPADGIARPALLMRAGSKIVVVQHEFKLYLYVGGKVLKTYPVAVGQPAYPTPTGDYVVTEKVENPTWTPPNSPWAAGLEPIPAGPYNPLGTRWIGTSAPLVGIHGTPDDWSIGSAASHGCIRMHISDVEDLFPHVVVGETVQIKP